MIEKKLLNEIKQFCQLNNIKDVKLFVNRLLLESFNKLKYGDSPFKKAIINKEEIIEEAETTSNKLNKKGIQIIKKD